MILQYPASLDNKSKQQVQPGLTYKIGKKLEHQAHTRPSMMFGYCTRHVIWGWGVVFLQFGDEHKGTQVMTNLFYIFKTSRGRLSEELGLWKAQRLAPFYQPWGPMSPSERNDTIINTSDTVRSLGSLTGYVLTSLMPQDLLAFIPNKLCWMKQI